MGESVQAYIALGSNLGAREIHLYQARLALEMATGIEVVCASRIYETDPVGPEGQGPYLNAVLGLQTELSARALLDQLLEIECQQGRRRGIESERWSARTLDLDLLLYGDSCIDEPGLEVPHPRLHERGFVLAPLCELAGSRVHPSLGKPLDTLLRELNDSGWVRVMEAAGPGWGRSTEARQER